ncbi:ICln family transporter: chloride ion current inducer protein I(Cln) [Dorcoceras hygrometricum]|uniref:ICln family transporter: chloride ion current inducer protein I(Cln) n=1 Tax=Dorcoceras hygrometricum TaxID=472368 RepID=A0A2Z7DGH5_9LAMI|nr:ICln family transporter: chloride ion current inducer protein I(Cln) [Dorcoceras hygrometricum]
MAASFYSNSVHVDFESILAMGEPGMVSMFQALIASGLQGFLGCPAVVYEDALVEFFANGTVRDGLVVSSVNGVVVEISEELFAETFDLPVVGLADVSEMPKDKIFDARSIVSLTGEPITVIDKSGAQEPADAPKVKKAPKKKVASRKRPADIPSDVPVVKKKRTSKKKSTLEIVVVAQEAIPILNVDATASSRPPISQDISAAFADFQATLSEQMFVSQSDFSYRLHKIEQSVCDSLRDQADIFRNLSQGARQEVHTLDDVQTIRFNDFRKHVLAQNASIFTGLADVRQEVQAVNAKVDIMASRLNAIQKDAEATKEALSHQLLEFQSQAQEIHNVIHAQLSELVDYIHRGSADKKGESGSRGLQQPANTQIEGSAVTPTFAQRVEIAQRRIVHTVLDVDANRALFERQDAAERDRERRRREASCRTLQEIALSIYSGISAVGVFVRVQQIDSSRAISRYRFEFQRVLLRSSKRQRFDKLERRRWSAQLLISRYYFVVEISRYIFEKSAVV